MMRNDSSQGRLGFVLFLLQLNPFRPGLTYLPKTVFSHVSVN